MTLQAALPAHNAIANYTLPTSLPQLSLPAPGMQTLTLALSSGEQPEPATASRSHVWAQLQSVKTRQMGAVTHWGTVTMRHTLIQNTKQLRHKEPKRRASQMEAPERGARCC
jgi:hypothetical protein